MPVDRPLDIVIGSLAVIAEGYFVFDARLRAQTDFADPPPVQRVTPPQRSLDKTGLSKREITVLQRIGDGQSNKEIARELDISPFTVRIHVSALLKSLGVATRSAAASYAASRGFV